MTDELTKLAGDMAASLTGEFRGRDYVLQSHHAAEKAKALLLAYIENERPTQRQADVIAALDALILTPPVDPVVALFREAFAGSEVNNLGGYWSVERRFRELVSKRGLELRTVADGGGA